VGEQQVDNGFRAIIRNMFTTKLFQPCARAVSSMDSVISTENGVVTVSSASTPMVLAWRARREFSSPTGRGRSWSLR
jgi:hypothetical protein